MKTKAVPCVIFKFSDNSTFHLFANETARDDVAKLKKLIEEKGTPIKTATSIVVKVCES
jgi:hypothetical protein